MMKEVEVLALTPHTEQPAPGDSLVALERHHFVPLLSICPGTWLESYPLPTVREIVGKRSSYHSPPPSLQPQEEPQE